MKVILAIPKLYELIKNVEDKKLVDGLYFLGIDLKTDITGIELVAEIRKYDKRGMIVFVTVDKDSIKLTFKHHIEAMVILIKKMLKIWRRKSENVLFWYSSD